MMDVGDMVVVRRHRKCAVARVRSCAVDVFRFKALARGCK